MANSRKFSDQANFQTLLIADIASAAAIVTSVAVAPGALSATMCAVGAAACAIAAKETSRVIKGVANGENHHDKN